MHEWERGGTHGEGHIPECNKTEKLKGCDKVQGKLECTQCMQLKHLNTQKLELHVYYTENTKQTSTYLPELTMKS